MGGKLYEYYLVKTKQILNAHTHTHTHTCIHEKKSSCEMMKILLAAMKGLHNQY